MSCNVLNIEYIEHINLLSTSLKLVGTNDLVYSTTIRSARSCHLSQCDTLYSVHRDTFPALHHPGSVKSLQSANISYAVCAATSRCNYAIL